MRPASIFILDKLFACCFVSVSLPHSGRVSQVFVAKEQQSYAQGEDLEDLEDDEKEELKAKLELGLSKVTHELVRRLVCVLSACAVTIQKFTLIQR